MPLKGLQQTQ